MSKFLKAIAGGFGHVFIEMPPFMVHSRGGFAADNARLRGDCRRAVRTLKNKTESVSHVTSR